MLSSSSSSSSSSGPDLSNIPLDTLCEIMKRVEEVPDVISCRSVCRAWRNLPYANKTLQIPWLLFSSSGDKIDYFYSMSEKKNKYGIHLPDNIDDDRRWIGSSQGFLINVDSIADLHAINPITGTHVALPPTSKSPDVTGVVNAPKTGQITHYIQISNRKYFFTPVSTIRAQYYKKVILSPSNEIAVAITCRGDMVYTMVGDNKWTFLHAHAHIDFCDATFHKGRLHAVSEEGIIAIFDDLSSRGKFTFVYQKCPFSGICDIFCRKKYLVESPDGEDLFLVYKELKTEFCRSTFVVSVFLLDKATYTWNRMTSLGDVAIFLGINHSMSLCTREHPCLKRNSVYFTGKEFTIMFIFNETEHVYDCDMVVFNLKDGSIEQINVDSNLDRVDWPGPIWFKPILS